MTVKRRSFRKFLGKTYPMPWRKLEPNYTEEVFSNYVGYETLRLSADTDTIHCIPKDSSLEIEIISKEQINRLGKLGPYDRRDIIYQLKNGVENGRIEFAWEPTLPAQARK